MSKGQAAQGANDAEVKPTGGPRGAKLFKSADDRREERERKRMAVLLTSAEMFLEHGSHRVTMNEIADELGITKPALYNYFASKEDILFECFRQGNLVTQAQLDAIETSGGTGLDRLRKFIRTYVDLIALDYGSVMTRLQDNELADSRRAEVRRYKRDIDSRVRAIIAQGMKDGSIVTCDVKMATFAILGSLNWVGQWYDAAGPATTQEIGDQFSDRLTGGLIAIRSAKDSNA